MRIEDSDLAREVNDTSGHPLRKSPHETDAEYRARVDEFMADREVVDIKDEDVVEFDREANETDAVRLSPVVADAVGVDVVRDEDEDEDEDVLEDIEPEDELRDTRASDEGETRAFDIRGETR